MDNLAISLKNYRQAIHFVRNSATSIVPEDDIPSGIIPGKWRQAVIDEQGRVNVVSFELCVLTQLRDRVRARGTHGTTKGFTASIASSN